MVFADRLIMNLANVIVRVQTDDGIEGVAGSSTYLGARAVAAALAELRPLLIGEDPLYRERIWQRLNEVSILMVPPHSLALVDCALWDLAGLVFEPDRDHAGITVEAEEGELPDDRTGEEVGRARIQAAILGAASIVPATLGNQRRVPWLKMGE